MNIPKKKKYLENCTNIPISRVREKNGHYLEQIENNLNQTTDENGDA